MPIYAYRCQSCGHAKDVLRKISDPVLSTCPACNAETFQKQVTAAGFQLKGSGWYVTDFRGGSNGGGATAAAAGGTAAGAAGAASGPAGAGAASSSTATSPAASSSDGGGTSAGGCGTSCACH